MRNFLKGLLALIVGFVVGSAVNMGLILAGGRLIAPPPGMDTSTSEGLKAAMPLFGPQHFLMPFLAHALGTLAGAFVATWLAGRVNRIPALLVGLLFLAGGVAAVYMLPAPLWFEATDLLLAYLPCAWLGFLLARKRV